MGSPPVVRSMALEDLRSVMAIDAAVYPKPWSSVFWKDQLQRHSDRTFVVAIDPASDAVVGHGGVVHATAEAHVTTIAVDPAHQRRGVGATILAELQRAAIDADAEAMTLEVRASNSGAIALYRRFGFAPAGVRPNYYSDTGEDALIMWAHDIRRAVDATAAAQGS